MYEKKIWLNAYEQKIQGTIDFTDTLVPQYLTESAAEFPDQIALIFQGYSVTFKELDEMVGKFAAALKDFGIKKGDSVAILLPNLIPCVVAYYATLRIGGIVVFNNPLYSDTELEHQFTDSGSKFLITLDLLAARMVKLREKPISKPLSIPPSETICRLSSGCCFRWWQRKRTGRRCFAGSGSACFQRHYIQIQPGYHPGGCDLG